MSDNTKKSKFYLTNEDVYKYFREESAKEAHSSDEGWMGLNLSHDVALNRMPHSLCHEAKDGIIPNDCIAVNVERNFFYNKVLRFHDFDARVKFQQIRNNAIRDAETADFLENYCNNIPTSKNELRYYLSRDTIQSLSGPYNPRPEFFLEPHLISVAKDGKIPEGAAEVVFKDSLKIGPYIEDPSLLNEALDNFEDPCFIPSLFFEFADKENRNKCQAMVESALEKTLSKIKEQEPEQKSQSHSQSHTQSR